MVGAVKEPVQNYDLMTAVMVCLGEPEQGDSDILKLLNTLFSNEIEVETKELILSKDFNISVTPNLEGRLLDMCNLSVGFEERGWRKGRAEGRAEGKAEGRTEGILETTITSIRNLTETLGLSVENAMAALKIPENEQQKYLELLEKQ